jgi:hypothetical protein
MTMDFDVATPGIAFFYIYSLLDNDTFLDLYRVASSISGFLARRWFVRGAHVYFNKSINDQPQRDASANAAEADVYYFFVACAAIATSVTAIGSRAPTKGSTVTPLMA